MKLFAYLFIVVALLTLVPWLFLAPPAFRSINGTEITDYIVPALVAAYPLWLLAWLWSARHSLHLGDGGSATVRAMLSLLPALFVTGVLWNFGLDRQIAEKAGLLAQMFMR